MSTKHTPGPWKVGMKTYDAAFWTSHEMPQEGSAMDTACRRIWAQHENRVGGTISIDACERAVNQIIGEVA